MAPNYPDYTKNLVRLQDKRQTMERTRIDDWKWDLT
jgi:hypothetical protein